MLQTKVADKIETHILCSITFFPPENRAVYEIMWRTIPEPARHRRQYVASALRAGHPRLQTHLECVVLIAFQLKKWLHERASISRLYVHCPFCKVITLLYILQNDTRTLQCQVNYIAFGVTHFLFVCNNF